VLPASAYKPFFTAGSIRPSKYMKAKIAHGIWLMTNKMMTLYALGILFKIEIAGAKTALILFSFKINRRSFTARCTLIIGKIKRNL
jgi:hypothetical protein